MPTLSEAESKRRLAAHGIPVVDERIVATADDAVDAAGTLGYPVALKLCGDTITHKTERALVRLGLGDAGAVRAAGAELLGAALPSDGEVSLLVAPMVPGHRELIAGLQRDLQFGMTIMLGIGGVLAEAVADVAFRLVPLDTVDAEELIDDLGTTRLLGPFRGEAALDRAALVDLLVGLSQYAGTEPRLQSADLNPVIIRPDGQPVAVDALVELSP